MEIKYLIDGRQVEVIEKVSKGYLVSDVYEYYSDGEDPQEYTNEYPYIAKEVFDKAPTKKFDETIIKLQEDIDKLHDKKRELITYIDTSQHEQAENIKKYQKYSQLKLLNDFIDNKITHYVLLDSRDYDIVEWSTTESEYACSERGIGKMKLLSLFGKADGNLEWGLNQYSDGSGGSGTLVYPAISYENALELLTEHLNTVIQQYYDNPATLYYADKVVRSAKKYNIQLSEKFIEVYKEAKAVEITKQVEQVKKEIQQAENRLKGLEEQLNN